jgi:2-keto-4-pentenoate hydratase/2-oxohepta-3-ene-1,7-dioic acid hydratase in catechol pathway
VSLPRPIANSRPALRPLGVGLNLLAHAIRELSDLGLEAKLTAAGIVTRQYGEIRQNSKTAQMVYGVAQLISFASSFNTLEPGDVLFTGTPEGVGPIVSGDKLRAWIGGWVK